MELHSTLSMNGGGMMWGMGIAGVIILLLLVFLLAALIKYLFFR